MGIRKLVLVVLVCLLAVTVHALDINKKKPRPGKTMWYWTDEQQHVLVTPYENFDSDLNKVIEAIFRKQYQCFAVGLYNELGKEAATFKAQKDLELEAEGGVVHNVVPPDTVRRELSTRIEELEREKKENLELRDRIDQPIESEKHLRRPGDIFHGKSGERQRRQKLTSVKAIDARNRELDEQIRTIENLAELFCDLSVPRGQKRMCLIAVRSDLKVSDIQNLHKVLPTRKREPMEPIRTSKKTMRQLGIGSK